MRGNMEFQVDAGPELASILGMSCGVSLDTWRKVMISNNEDEMLVKLSDRKRRNVGMMK